MKRKRIGGIRALKAGQIIAAPSAVPSTLRRLFPSQVQCSSGTVRVTPQSVLSMVPDERIARSILVLRGRRVLLDADLAVLYGVETRALVQAVKRNPDRFPANFTSQLNSAEAERLRSQTVI